MEEVGTVVDSGPRQSGRLSTHAGWKYLYKAMAAVQLYLHP